MFSQDPLTRRPLLSELNVSLLLLNMVTRPPWSQNCLSLQRSVAGHVAMRAATPWMARRRRQTGAGVIISSSGWWRIENWHKIRRYREKCTDHGTRAATQMLTTVTQHRIVWACYLVTRVRSGQQKSQHSLTNFPPQAFFSYPRDYKLHIWPAIL